MGHGKWGERERAQTPVAGLRDGRVTVLEGASPRGRRESLHVKIRGRHSCENASETELDSRGSPNEGWRAGGNEKGRTVRRTMVQTGEYAWQW